MSFPVLELIGEDLKFNPAFQTVLSEKSGLEGTDYNLVAVFGCQSSGKSTLLNSLFGTKFAVMDNSKGRCQTTRGVWLSKPEGQKLLVLDLEGCDSRERGDTKNAIERKFALFSVALSEVLIINMWLNDIGRYDAANYGLLRTVFDVHLQLFGANACRSLILFVIRDYDERTPEENLREILSSDMSKIFDEIPKPEGLQGRRVSDFFDFEFRMLPHFFLNKDGFARETQRLRADFPGLFAAPYHEKIEAMPVDGFAEYAQRVWEVIDQNRDLDIPSEQVMVANIKCNEAKKELLAAAREEFQGAFAEWEAANDPILAAERQFPAESTVSALAPFRLTLFPRTEALQELLEAFEAAVAKATTEFNVRVGRYVTEVFEAHRGDLLKSIRADLSEFLGVVVAAVEKSFDRNFTSLLAFSLARFNFWCDQEMARTPTYLTDETAEQLCAVLDTPDAWFERLDFARCAEALGFPRRVASEAVSPSAFYVNGLPDDFQFFRPAQDAFLSSGLRRTVRALVETFEDSHDFARRQVLGVFQLCDAGERQAGAEGLFSEKAGARFQKEGDEAVANTFENFKRLLLGRCSTVFRCSTSQILRQPARGMWDEVCRYRDACALAAYRVLDGVLQPESLDLLPPPFGVVAQSVADTVRLEATAPFNKDTVVESIVAIFQRDFARDADGLPRAWERDTNIRKIFRGSREVAHQCFNECKAARFSPLPVPHATTVSFAPITRISKNVAATIWGNVEQIIEAKFSEAQRIQEERARSGRVSPLLVLVLLFAARRDIASLLANPLLLLVLFSLAALFVGLCAALRVSPLAMAKRVKKLLLLLRVGGAGRSPRG